MPSTECSRDMYQRRSWQVAQLAALPSLGRIPSTLSPGSPVRRKPGSLPPPEPCVAGVGLGLGLGLEIGLRLELGLGLGLGK